MKFFHHLLIALFLFSANFFAQSDNEDYTLEEIIVTAQKTEKSLQDVPIAVSALSADDLALRQAVRFTDLQLNVPNLSYSETNFGGSSVSIRGIGRLATGISFDQSVTTHINESPWGENTNVATMFDMDRVEVLRGPQGTLFGRGTTAGLVNLVTKRPSVDSGVEGYAVLREIRLPDLDGYNVGDELYIQSCRPISARKRWVVISGEVKQ